jgi:hypothetical protein
MEQNPTLNHTNGLRDAIVTLPNVVIWGLLLLCISLMGCAIVLVLKSDVDVIKTVSAQSLLFLIPTSIATLAAMGLRRASTKQIDQLVDSFLTTTMIQRFEAWTQALPVLNGGQDQYPFKAVKLLPRQKGQSYAFYELSHRGGSGKTACVGIKMNVFNFEVLCQVRCNDMAKGLALPIGTQVFKPLQDLDFSKNFAAFALLAGCIQGSVNEGYEVRISVHGDQIQTGQLGVKYVDFSFRQKLRENFLASPYLRRYFAEDAAILIGVLFTELLNNQLLAEPKL